MTDHTSEGFDVARSRAPGFEYRVYFAIIFVIALPLSFVSWALGLSRPGSDEKEGKGFIGHAWHQASVITPLIFTA